eukprot:CAMPEP_0185785016 /NCGR_PEP_ID=MMETSP1174-20130828/127009_1 /TAXON_ID=35687 /ORGANISM="Dictyocha speculum, Strain CCMP1381" /LENGTH=89 /DNA_ID=CAMNT_0028476907 /DNA_START=15 /DNA_END=281 /DNA_ORIENTATION=-
MSTMFCLWRKAGSFSRWAFIPLGGVSTLEKAVSDLCLRSRGRVFLPSESWAPLRPGFGAGPVINPSTPASSGTELSDLRSPSRNRRLSC